MTKTNRSTAVKTKLLRRAKFRKSRLGKAELVQIYYHNCMLISSLLLKFAAKAVHKLGGKEQSFMEKRVILSILLLTTVV